MVTLDFKTLTVPVGILRILEVVFTCITFSVVASVGRGLDSFWIWCMFTWCFCFSVTLIILVLEFTSLSSKLPISWNDFTTAFAMLATLMVLTASLLYSIFFTCNVCGRQIGASVLSFLTFILYAVEVGLTRAKPGEISGFLSTVPGLLKVLEAFVACIIFICVDFLNYSSFPGLQWCVAVYSICFIFSLLIIILTVGRLLSRFPAPFSKVLTVCNVLAVLMYITAAIIWPFYCFKDNPRPSSCPVNCGWNLLVVVCFMTFFNLIAYIVDTVYSFKLVFFTTHPGAAMLYMNLKSITHPVGILRILAAIISCMCFSLVASVKPDSSPYWGWCMFTWVFCFFFTLLILILEFTTINTKVPFAWEDFTAAFAILSSVMCLCASIMYPTFFACNTCYRQIGASVVSWVCFAVYVAEVVLTRLRPSGQNSGFLSTLPGIMKMLESFFACLIFLSLESGHYSGTQYAPALNWCVAVYSLCFIFAITIILLTLGNLTIYFPFSFDKVLIVYNVLATVMYITAMVVWPLYSFHNNKRPVGCGRPCSWDKLVLITVMTIFNSVVYLLDSIYSILLVFFLSNE
ncbi:uncharacterized protein FYW61_016759 [Anableps anableps]